MHRGYLGVALAMIILIRLLGGSVSDASPGANAEAVEIHHVHGLGFDARDADTLYVATHTGLVRIARGAVVVVGAQRFDFMGFTAHPNRPGVAFASGHPDLATYRRERVGNLGLLVTRDGGETWEPVALRGEADFHALTYSPRDGGTLYGWSVAGRKGLHRIAVDTWQVTPVVGRGLAGVLALSASRDPDAPLLAGTEGGLLQSGDGGTTWSRHSRLPPTPVTAVAHDPRDGHRLLAYVVGPQHGLMASTDGGRTWSATGYSTGKDTAVVAIAAGPAQAVAIATTDGDVLRSNDAGRTWHAVVKRGRPLMVRP